MCVAHSHEATLQEAGQLSVEDGRIIGRRENIGKSTGYTKKYQIHGLPAHEQLAAMN
jgi:hypothetical protein